MYWIVSSRWPTESILVQGNNYARMKYLLLGLYLKPISHLDKKQRNRRKPYRLDPFNKTIITIADGRVAIRSSFHLVCPVLTVHILARSFCDDFVRVKTRWEASSPSSVLCSWDNKRPHRRTTLAANWGVCGWPKTYRSIARWIKGKYEPMAFTSARIVTHRKRQLTLIPVPTATKRQQT